MKPEERIAAALHATPDLCGHGIEFESDDWHDDIPIARAILAADPTIADDLELAAAVRRYKFFFTGDDVRASLKTLGPPGTKGEGTVKIAAEFGADIMDALR